MEIVGIVIFYENGKVHHARFDYQKAYEGNRVSNHSEYVYPKEINNEIVKVLKEKRLSDYQQLVDLGIIFYADYSQLTPEEKKHEDNLLKIRKKEDFNNSSFMNTIDLMDEVIDRVQEKLRSMHIDIKKLILYPLLAAIILGAGHQLIHNIIYDDTDSKTKAKKVATNLKDNKTVNRSDVDLLLSSINSATSSSYLESLDNIDLCWNIFELYESSVEQYYKTVMKRFEALHGLRSIHKMDKDELDAICVYVVNLLMGGDDYAHLSDSSSVIAENIVTNIGTKREDYIKSTAKSYNVSEKRVEYSATPSESDIFANLPPVIRYIILNQAEYAIKKIHFDYTLSDKPTWWANLNGKDKYDYFLEKVTNEKESCVQEMRNLYENNGKKM